jgi:acetyltransferase
MRALTAVTAWSPRRPTRDVGGALVDLDGLLRPGALPEHESAVVLERYGVRFAARRRCVTEDDVRAAVSEFGGTVVVKSDGPSHKARSGGVVLGVDDPDDAVEAARRMGFPVLVACQVEPGREVFLGMTRDPHYGPMLAVGRGGGDVEARGDVAIAVAPVDEDGARRLLASSGQPHDDRLVAWVVALGRIATHHPSVLEAELNPILLTVNGPIAVDALVVVADGV